MSRFWILAGAFTVAAATLALALLLGTWGFGYRRFSLHEGRLQRVMEHEPTMDQLTEGLGDEGATVLASPGGAEETERVIAAHGGAGADAIRQKARRWDQLRVFEVTDILYFVFFDEDGVMRDFAIVG